jgi:cytochrome c-type biogenesis protein CcmE
MAIGLVLVGLGLGTTFLLRAMNENILFYYSPSQVAAGEPPEGRRFRVGGLVVMLTDNAKTVPVVYSGILPDLFREGQGIIAHGEMTQDGSFRADEVLAKHDENYMPPEVEDSLKQVHGGSET